MRLTAREREIVELLKKEPLMSQDELAQSLGLSRSSVGVHISNLMKKGVILGKGYVFNEQVSIVVVGVSYLDIEIRGQRQKSKIDVDFSGLPIIAGEILSGFGIRTKLISIVGNDNYGAILIKRLQDAHIDTSNVYRHSSKRTCRRVMMEDGLFFEEGFETKDYQYAVNHREWMVFNCEWLMVDPQFQTDILKRSENRDDENMPCFCTYISLDNQGNIPDYLSRFQLVVLGVQDEACIDYYRKQLRVLSETADQHWIVTDGNSGLIYANAGSAVDYPLPPNQRFDRHKGLPCLLTGIVYGLSNGYPMRQAIRIGAGLASASESK